MSLQISQGFPDDALGVNGDYALDTRQRFFYGPKAAGTWAGTSTYALQGPSGPALLSDQGPPAATLGSQGQGYVDLSTGTTYLKSSSGWALATSQAFIGPQGPPGIANVGLTGSTFGIGPQAGLAVGTTTSANAVLPIPGTTTPQVFVAPPNTQFVGFTYLVPSASGGSVTFNLFDQTAGRVLYTSSAVAAGNVNISDKRSSAVDMVAGNQHVWRVNAGSNLQATVVPYYTLPAYGAVSTGTWPTAAFSTDTAFSGTAQNLRVIGAASNGPLQYLLQPRATYVQSVTVTVTGSASVNLALKAGSSTVYTLPVAVTATNSPYTTPLLGPGSANMAANASHLWTATGSGTGQVYLNTTYAG